MDDAWENFLEAIAGLLSKALTDKETEKVIAGFNNFQQRLQRLSSHNLRRLHLEITENEKQINKCKHEGKTCTQNVTRGFFKTWAIGYVAKYLIAVLPALLTGKAFKNPNILKKSGGSDTIRFAFFLSSFISTYKGVLCTMRQFRPDHEGDRLNAFVAGSVAGLTLTLDKNKSRRTALTLYIFTRSIQFGSSYAMKKWAEYRDAKRSRNRLALRDAVERSGEKQELITRNGWDDILAKVMTVSAATILMSLTASVNLYSCVIEPEALPRSYWNFLMQHSGLPQKFGPMFPPLMETFKAQYNILKELPGGMENVGIPKGISSRDFVAENMSPNIATLIPAHLHHDFQLCALLHPLTPCSAHALDVITGEFGRALKMYGTLNFIVTLVFQHKKLATQPKEVAHRYVKSTLRSCLFLTTYVLAAFYVPCLMRKIFKKEFLGTYLVNGLIAGLAVLIEAPGRQMELALYCLPRALETAWNLLLKRGLVRNISHGDIALFSASMGVMMSLYQNDPSVINKHYLTVLTRVFGRN
ncbi:hypothetical protein BX616_009158 [Lobosporangium transversale]|uniref:Transmembrane protein 135 N-terminal domain-containing protein n=1 Tax=Lobosporangium transversale TaxID=64571 RepID=A0A1Y2H342_9FUNG|nr:hypothetical protein BCR41DRAFT_344342 [Lobosporangium transversale]KAF9918365.1 hypothetical protein BX616_009158 [Lobosporangium transversale]ORZ28956.1 hypothetical protein BCR41DRAFT_344342 [Lobosporangium transversale]|eukprot:XP_021886629.1 hypothetical protein BCR41DRAFT_344342 [Lobosporangium transversale]